MKSKVWLYPDDRTKKAVYVNEPWKTMKVSIPSHGRNNWLIPLLTKIQKHQRVYDFFFQFLIWEEIIDYGLG